LVSESPLREHQEPGGGRKVSRATLGPGSTITAADGTTLFVKDWQGDARNDRPAVFLRHVGQSDAVPQSQRPSLRGL
jgi:hypothetical protein